MCSKIGMGAAFFPFVGVGSVLVLQRGCYLSLCRADYRIVSFCAGSVLNPFVWVCVLTHPIPYCKVLFGLFSFLGAGFCIKQFRSWGLFLY